MKVAFFSSEVYPFAKTGGLADVVGSLPHALEKSGVESRVVMPAYKGIDVSEKSIGKKNKVLFVRNDDYFKRDGLYGDSRGDYGDNARRFSFFCREGLALLQKDGFCPDIIHCHDWQSALVPALLKNTDLGEGFFKSAKTIFTIHNIGYQGLFPQEEFSALGLPWSLYTSEGLEFYGKVNLMKAGILFADCVTTVSPTHADEIQMQEFGFGLDGLLRKYAFKLKGILNGIDYEAWNPKTDKNLAYRYDAKSIRLKADNKLALQKQLKIAQNKTIPMCSFVGRLAEQKGIELIIAALEFLHEKNMQVVILGTGDARYHEALKKAAKLYPGVSLTLAYDAQLANRIYAASDMFLMPSRYEPCGLGQMISMRYGTVPIARETGGLKDSIIDYRTSHTRANGFLFKNFDAGELKETLAAALTLYNDKKPQWHNLVTSACKSDFSWEASAKKYVSLFKELGRNA